MSAYYDPDIVSLITYLDTEGNRRVKPPYKNRKTHSRFVLWTAESYPTPLPENTVGKSVVVNFPSGTSYIYTVNAAAGVITIYGAPVDTFFEILIIDPNPIPKSPTDPLWDLVPEDAKRALVIAWSDLVCYSEFDGTVNTEWGFDDQDVQKFIGWRNNYGNFKGTDL